MVCRVKKLSRFLFYFGIFLMVTGDLPRYPFGVKEKHFIFLLFSWPRLYLFVLGLSILLWIFCGGIGKSRPRFLSSWQKPLCFLFAAFVCSVLGSTAPGQSGQALFIYGSFFFFMALLTQYIESEVDIKILWAVIGSALIYLSARTISWRVSEGLFKGTYHVGNNSWLGKLQISWVFNFFAPFIFFRVLESDTLKFRWFYGLAWLLSALAVWLLFARTGILTFIVTALGAAFLMRRGWRRWLPLAVILGALLLPAVRYSGDMSGYVFWSTVRLDEEAGVLRRFAIWKESWTMFKDHPLLGIGLGAYDDVAYSIYHTLQDRSGSTINWYYRNGWHAHNYFVHNLVEIGLLGMAAWSYFWFLFFSRLLQSWKRARGELEKQHIFSVFLCVTAFFILAQTENLMSLRVHESFRMNAVFWLLLILGVSRASSFDLVDADKV